MTSLADRTHEPVTRARLNEFTDDLDDTTRAIRQTILRLRHSDGGAKLNARVFAAVRDLMPVLGCTPGLRLDGPLDTLVSAHIAEHAAAVLREALTNVARHAQATWVDVLVSAADLRQLTVTVTDDGVGLADPQADPQHVGGLANIRSRADQLGGSCSIASPVTHSRGTRVKWAVPLTAE
jgi:signal transduction histidine kinase